MLHFFLSRQTMFGTQLRKTVTKHTLDIESGITSTKNLLLKGNCITLPYDLTVTLEFGIYAKILLVSNPQFNKRNTILPTKLLVEKLRYNDRHECDLRNILKTYTRKLASSYFIDYATSISSNKRIKICC